MRVINDGHQTVSIVTCSDLSAHMPAESASRNSSSFKVDSTKQEYARITGSSVTLPKIAHHFGDVNWSNVDFV